jgi:hypothetical protein
MPRSCPGPTRGGLAGQAQRLGFDAGATLQVLQCLEREVDEVAGAARRVENAKRAKPIKIAAKEVRSFVVSAGARARRLACARSHQLLLDPRFGICPLGFERPFDDRLDDLLGVGVVGGRGNVRTSAIAVSFERCVKTWASGRADVGLRAR